MRIAIGLSILQVFLLAAVVSLGAHLSALDDFRGSAYGLSVTEAMELVGKSRFFDARVVSLGDRIVENDKNVDKLFVVESRLPSQIMGSAARVWFYVAGDDLVDYGFTRYDQTTIGYLSWFGVVLAFLCGMLLRVRRYRWITAGLAVAVGISAAWALEYSLIAGAGHKLAAFVAGAYVYAVWSSLGQSRGAA